MDRNLGRVNPGCDYKNGSLDECAPLSVAYVPFQQENAPKYKSEDALARGTLFPGLDLPWKNVVNEAAGRGVDTPMQELMTLGFVVDELGLYLNTHRYDQEALDMFVRYAKLYNEGVDTYAKRYGPILQTQVTEKGYTWLDDPWPWDYTPRGMQDNMDMKNADMQMNMNMPTNMDMDTDTQLHDNMEMNMERMAD